MLENDVLKNDVLASYKTWLDKDPETALMALRAQGQNWMRSAGEPLMSGLTGDVKVAAKAVTLETQNTPNWLNAVLGVGAAAGGGWLTYETLKNGVGWLGGAASEFGGPIAAGYLAKEAADVFDPKGNFWGLTTPIDEFFKRRFGWNPSNLFEKGAAPEGAAYDPLYDPNSPKNVARTNRSLNCAGYLTWNPNRHSYQDTGELEAEGDRELSCAWAASPGAKAATAEALDVFKAKAQEAEAQLHALEQPIHPKVDASGLDALEAKLRGISAMIGSINAGIGHMGSAAIGGFTPRGAPLHDGPEAK